MTIEIPQIKKKCSVCKCYKSIKDFCNSKRYKDGKHNQCKKCVKDYYNKKRGEISEQKKKYYKDNKGIINEKFSRYRINNVDKLKVIKKNEYNRNKERYSKYRKEYEIYKLNTDAYFKFKHYLRSRIRTAIKNKYKVGSAVRDLGCTGKEAYDYIAKKFTEGMSWDNYGEWHVDHIKPLSKFDLNDREQFLEAVNYKNLQPLWAYDNLSKGNRN